MCRTDLEAKIHALDISKNEYLAIFCTSEYPLDLLCMIEKIVGWGRHYGEDWLGAPSDALRALNALLHRDILTVIDSQRQMQILDYIKQQNLEGPFTFFPDIGTFEFTKAGAEIWLELSGKRQLQEANRADLAFCHDIDQNHIAIVGPTERSVLRFSQDAAPSGTFVVSTSPIRTLDSWCTRWWDQYPSGFMIELTIEDSG